MNANGINKLSERQTSYALRMFKCTPLTAPAVGQIDNSMYFDCDRPFVLLHAFTVNRQLNRDRYSDLSQGVSNALLYLDNHPIVQVAQVAEISSFHIAAGRFFVDDLRPIDGDVDIDGNTLMRDDFEQYVFVLVCINF
ncbi:MULTISPECIES: hypothetical protein [unclassified Dysgonomonas]|uniref:hypothetical protein n=1 Tax=unclassified Dysgonomonas TaxID=2630389 RepID=UPI0025BBF51B|nr:MULTISPECIES: hypothetical protein [unclassified Dysgonomonas]HMM02739.1 hypothetical protein [Dysgonomonas sp.]